jgi:hypothetical protein
MDSFPGVGPVVNLRRIVSPLVGQVVNLRRIVNPPRLRVNNPLQVKQPALQLILAIAQLAWAGGAPAEYVGGTVAALAEGTRVAIDVSDQQYLAFYAHKTQLRVPYARVNLLEYGQKVNRRIAAAIVISPMFLLSKSRKHFLSVGYTADDGSEQALVLRVDKNSIRAILVSLEARTGRKIVYQDEEARKAGRG